MSDKGIWDIWDKIVESIESLAQRNCYERLNTVASLGFVSRFRSIAASMIPCRGVILDAGCGPGTSTLTILKRCGSRAKIVALDPSISMLHEVPQTPLCAKIGGRFERLPFTESSIDAIIAMFSFRDASSYREALDEFSRVLKPNGVLVILDIFKPKRLFPRMLLKGYLYGVGLLGGAVTLCASEGRRYSNIIYTIDRMLTLDEIIDELRSRFRSVMVHRGPMIATLRAEGKRR